ncbi:uncharacterized protein LAESUDRAFT_816957 [Laetiporus sulphureus 93-53]|uniref:Uncharacterized protein n=1 Tax=Laetiporus sulphureus 93-53 TaxID=1314785 RepID=A0A165ANS8_9APHY|nr:uncharacterized protein LAESUDRAFT_816957 [Laetiporus sulphureus 93-53]KZS99362.1 hypothetical protein LAESUDRAFT_816957 [Laetiporus sulphureus 93-53]
MHQLTMLCLHSTELAQPSGELQSQQDNMTRICKENRKIWSDHDELQLCYNEEVYNGGSWKKDKECLEIKNQDLTKAYESSTTAQSEQQNQIISLHLQVRELRSMLNDTEMDRALLQKARRALQAELDAIKIDKINTSKMTSETEMQKLKLEKQDLERTLEEQNDRVKIAFERMKKVENYTNECQIELGKIRVENLELDKLNANLEKQIKELNVCIVDL